MAEKQSVNRGLLVRARARGAWLWWLRRPRLVGAGAVVGLAWMLHACQPAYAQFQFGEDVLPSLRNLAGGMIGERNGDTTRACAPISFKQPSLQVPVVYQDSACEDVAGRVTQETVAPRTGCGTVDLPTQSFGGAWHTLFQTQAPGRGEGVGYLYVDTIEGGRCRWTLDQRRYRHQLSSAVANSCRTVGGVHVGRATLLGSDWYTPAQVGEACSTGLWELADAVWIGLSVTGLMTVLMSAAGLVGALVAAAGGRSQWQAYVARQEARQMADELAAYGAELDWRMDEESAAYFGGGGRPDHDEALMASFDAAMYHAEMAGLSKRRAQYYRDRRESLRRAGRWSYEQEHGLNPGGPLLHSWDGDSVRSEDHRAV